MSKIVDIGLADELKDGEMKEVSAEGRKILLARVGGNYYAMDSTCSHMRGNLSKGNLEGTIVTCPRHGSQFDLRDGHVVRWLKKTDFKEADVARKGLATYNVTVKDNKISIEI